MTATSDIPEEGQLWCRKRSLSTFLLYVNININTSNKPKDALNLAVAVYCHCSV